MRPTLPCIYLRILEVGHSLPCAEALVADFDCSALVSPCNQQVLMSETCLVKEKR